MAITVFLFIYSIHHHQKAFRNFFPYLPPGASRSHKTGTRSMQPVRSVPLGELMVRVSNPTLYTLNSRGGGGGKPRMTATSKAPPSDIRPGAARGPTVVGLPRKTHHASQQREKGGAGGPLLSQRGAQHGRVMWSPSLWTMYHLVCIHQTFQPADETHAVLIADDFL